MVPPISLSCDGSQRPTSETLVRRLAANLAHNLNNALTGTIGYLELALREAEPHSRQQDHLQRSLSCSFRVAEMVRRILAFAYQPTSQTQSTRVSLRQVAEHVGHALRDPQTGTVPSVSVQAESDGWILASTTLVHLAVDQLISNALEAMPASGTLAIRVWDEGTTRCLSVADTGGGMSAEVQGHLFEPFFTTKFSGHLGLGLALSRDVVAALGGSIRVISSEGAGTTVVLAFPSAEQTPLSDLPIDERISLLAPGRLHRHTGPHFVPALPAETTTYAS